MHVLIVEDNEVESRIQAARLGLRPTPFRPVTVGSVDHALDHLSHEHVDVVLLDLELPDASGVEAVHAIRRRHADLPIVVLTGTLDERIYQAARDAGATDVTRKGADSDEHLELRLLSAVHRMARPAGDDPLQPAARALAADMALHVQGALEALDEAKAQLADGDSTAMFDTLDRLEALLDPMRIPDGPDMLLQSVGICQLIADTASPLAGVVIPAADAMVHVQVPSLKRAFEILMPVLTTIGDEIAVDWSTEGETVALVLKVPDSHALVRRHPLVWTLVVDLLALSMAIAKPTPDGILMRFASG